MSAGITAPSSAPRSNRIDLRFRARAAEFPERLAVADTAGRQLSYRELDRMASSVAHHLISEGFHQGGIVGLLLERSVATLAAVLGILRAGGAYLPLDPEHPPNRRRAILDSSKAAVLISSRRIVPGPDSRGGGPRVIFLEDVLRAASAVERVDLETLHFGRTVPESLAYSIYTSGSTGEPKGTLNTHRAVLALFEAFKAEFHERSRCLRTALIASFVFDASVQQIFTTLLAGHTLYLAGAADKVDGQSLIDFYHRWRIEVTDGTPAHLKMMAMAMANGAPPPPTRRFLIGGETLAPTTVRDFLDGFGASPPELYNLYGVAECGVDTALYRVDPNEVTALGFVPVGKELPHFEAVLLDRHGRTLEMPGTTGELCLAGVALGQGYLRQPRLTAAAFVPHPQKAGERLYRTGDLAQRLANGTLRLLGRVDRQVQMRGYRIELDEIEQHLLGFEAAPPKNRSESAETPESCTRCLLTARHPGVEILEGICNVCRHFDGYRQHVEAYFKTHQDLRDRVESARRGASRHDVLLLFSGGKDSTYALYRLLEMGFQVLTFTFDNGYISDTAFKNIERITRSLGVAHEVGRVEKMHEIFAASLHQESTVCGGCFRGLTALSTTLAAERGIPVIMTGLSRGQIFHTKLHALFNEGVYEEKEIEHRLLLHRRFYHSRGDRIARLIGLPQRNLPIEELSFLDFFRYDHSTVSQIRADLRSRDQQWENPEDTGLCSTNCRINDVGIFAHQHVRGFHNYAEPLSWDVRLGVLSREEGQGELDQAIDPEKIRKIFGEVGYCLPNRRPIRDAAVLSRALSTGDSELVAFYAADGEVSPRELRDFLRRELPAYMVPGRFEALESLPLTPTGKKDYVALSQIPLSGGQTQERAASDLEKRLFGLWSDVLEHERFGLDDDFVDAGGDSLRAVLLLTLIHREFGVEVPLTDAFTNPTIRHLAALIEQGREQLTKAIHLKNQN